MAFVMEKDGVIEVSPTADGYDETWNNLGETDRDPQDYEVWDQGLQDWVVDSALQAELQQKQADNQEEETLKGSRRKLMRKAVRKALKLQADMELELGSIGQGQYDARIAWIQTNVPDIN